MSERAASWWTCTITGLPGRGTTQIHRRCRDLTQALQVFSRDPDYLRGTRTTVEEIP